MLSQISDNCGAKSNAVKCSNDLFTSGTAFVVPEKNCDDVAAAINKVVAEYSTQGLKLSDGTEVVCNLAGYLKVQGEDCTTLAEILNGGVHDVQNGYFHRNCEISTVTSSITSTVSTTATTTITSTAYKGIECAQIAGSSLLLGGTSSKRCKLVSKELSEMASTCGLGKVVLECKDTTSTGEEVSVLVAAAGVSCLTTAKAINALLDGFSTGESFGEISCELGGFIKDDVNCQASGTLLTTALAAYHAGSFSGCSRTTITTTVTSTASSTVSSVVFSLCE